VASVLASLEDAIDETRGELIELLVRAGALEDLQSFDTSSHGQGVTRKGTGLPPPKKKYIYIYIYIYIGS